MEEYSKDDTTDERRDEISDMWSDHLDDAFAEMFDGASTIAASVAGLATAVAVLSFWSTYRSTSNKYLIKLLVSIHKTLRILTVREI